MQPQLDFSFALASIFTSVAQVYNLSSVSMQSVASFLPNVDEGVVQMLKTFSLLMCLTLLAGIVWTLMQKALLNKPASPVVLVGEVPQPAAEGPWAARWKEIMHHMESAKEAEWKFAVIEADALIDRVLAKSGFAGDTLGERLMNIQPGQLAALEQLWAAHKVRNQVAHQPDYFLRYSEARQAIQWYEMALQELAAI